jgi:glucan phosphoethanolaminetransferase (alkaline phosphatase superfamily)
MTMKYPEKIIVLWIAFLLGLLFHTQLGLMPLFHGLSVAESSAKSMTEIAPILWLMLLFFVLPMCAIIATAFTATKQYRRIHFGLTLLYSVLNFCHLAADLLLEHTIWYQNVLMMILFAIGLLLNWVSFQWMRKSSQHRLLRIGDRDRSAALNPRR